MREIKGLEGGVNEIFTTGLSTDGCDRGCGRDEASASLAMAWGLRRGPGFASCKL